MIFCVVVVVAILSTIAFGAGAGLTIEGVELTPIQKKAIGIMLDNAGIPKDADVAITVRDSEELTKTMGAPVIMVETMIITGNQILEGRCGFRKSATFEAIKRSVQEAADNFNKGFE